MLASRWRMGQKRTNIFESISGHMNSYGSLFYVLLFSYAGLIFTEAFTECYNGNLHDIVTPIDVRRYEYLLQRTKFDEQKSRFLLHGFKYGFDIGYRGPVKRRNSAANIPLTIGTHLDIWEKIMKEVGAGRVAGPFKEIPYKYYIQSPIGLVPKDGGKQTRLIFHLSYNFGPEEHQKSLNYHTPADMCSVKYKDLDYTVKTCLKLLIKDDRRAKGNKKKILYYSKSDVRAAFRLVPILPSQHCYLLFTAKHPITGEPRFFAEKNLPFGASVSCARFQIFSESLRHITEAMGDRSFRITNYLDDFLFIGETKEDSNFLVRKFIEICQFIGCPIARNKTEWADSRVVFLGMLLDGVNHCLVIPEEKRVKALNIVQWVLDQRKITIKMVQRLTGILNFLNKAIVPGRAFTQRMYSKLKTKDAHGRELKQCHHVTVTPEFKFYCSVWKYFLQNTQMSQLCRPFADFNQLRSAKTIFFYTDATLNPNLGMGGIFKKRWFKQKWDRNFILREKPSVAFLELYALVMGFLIWGNSEELRNCRIEAFCDNEMAEYGQWSVFKLRKMYATDLHFSSQ